MKFKVDIVKHKVAKCRYISYTVAKRFHGVTFQAKMISFNTVHIPWSMPTEVVKSALLELTALIMAVGDAE